MQREKNYFQEKFMKFLLFSALSIFTLESNAFTPVVICGNRDIVLDKGYVSRAGLEAQIVIKNEDILTYLVSTGAILPSEINEKGEFIFNGIILEENNFYAGGYRREMRGINFEKKGDGYNLEFYVNHYPKYDKIANFFFNDCKAF
jgi:hypothetical protein